VSSVAAVIILEHLGFFQSGLSFLAEGPAVRCHVLVLHASLMSAGCVDTHYCIFLGPVSVA
jgi:hypothetical protein